MSLSPHDLTTQIGNGRNRRFRKRLILFVLLGVAVVLIVLFALMLSTPARGEARENPTDGQRYVWIPAGGFLAGCSKSDAECSPDEKPTHDVTISKGFWIGQTEVTVGAYRRFASATHRGLPLEAGFGDAQLNRRWDDVRMPIVNVDWNEAQTFCKWIGGGLPTEAQWEYAARGGNPGARYGNLLQIAWFGDNAGAERLDTTTILRQDEPGYLFRLSSNRNAFHTVGVLAPNQVGLYDMLGNVWEWTADWYGKNYYQGSDWSNPIGPPNGETKVMRGGSWTNIPNAVRVSVRGRRSPSSRSVDTGFRCAW